MLHRDVPVMAGLTLAVFFLGLSLGKQGCIGRFKGFLLAAGYVAYTCWVSWALIKPMIGPAAIQFARGTLRVAQPLTDWLAGLF